MGRSHSHSHSRGRASVYLQGLWMARGHANPVTSLGHLPPAVSTRVPPTPARKRISSGSFVEVVTRVEILGLVLISPETISKRPYPYAASGHSKTERGQSKLENWDRKHDFNTTKRTSWMASLCTRITHYACAVTLWASCVESILYPVVVVQIASA